MQHVHIRAGIQLCKPFFEWQTWHTNINSLYQKHLAFHSYNPEGAFCNHIWYVVSSQYYMWFIASVQLCQHFMSTLCNTLPWLPIVQHIQYKTAMMTFSFVHGTRLPSGSIFWESRSGSILQITVIWLSPGPIFNDRHLRVYASLAHLSGTNFHHTFKMRTSVVSNLLEGWRLTRSCMPTHWSHLCEHLFKWPW